jgi:hypothetical protein
MNGDKKSERCTNLPLRNDCWTTVHQGVVCCINVLQNRILLQQVYAPMPIGYARVSTQDQETAAQIAALKTSGCELIFQERASGGRCHADLAR